MRSRLDSVWYATSRTRAWTKAYWPRPGERGSTSRVSSSRRTRPRSRGARSVSPVFATAARAGTLKLWPRTAASATSERSPGSRPSRRAATRAVRVSGTATSSRDPVGRHTPSSSTRRPWASSIRTVSTAYRGTPSALATMVGGGLRGQPGHETRQQALHVGGGQGLEVDRGERTQARPPVRAPVEELGPGKRDERDRDPAAPLHDVVDEVEQAWVRVLEVLEHQDHGRRVGQPLEERPPGGEQLVRADPGLDAEEGEQGGLDPALLAGVADVGPHGLGDVGPRGRLVIALGQARPAPDHLAQGPEGDPVPVGGGAARVPPDRVGQAVEVLRETPRRASSCRSRPGR